MHTTALQMPSEPSKSLTDGVAEMAVAGESVEKQDDLKLYERAAAGDQDLQRQMVESFSRESGMKPEWSRKCLVDQNWNYAVSYCLFEHFKHVAFFEFIVWSTEDKLSDGSHLQCLQHSTSLSFLCQISGCIFNVVF